jgi:hypothetical protein
VHKKFWSKNLEGGDHLEGPHIDGKIMLDLRVTV